MRVFWTQFVAVLLTSAATCALAAGTLTVSQRERAFSTGAVQIARSDTVQFTNDDAFVHQVYVSAPGFTFESDEQPPGATVRVPFPKPGTFVVLCHIHPKMHVTVAVQ